MHLLRGRTLAVGVLLGGAACAPVVQAWSLNLSPASRRVFLHVGNGTRDATNATINLVQVTVAGPALGTGVPQPMTTNSTQAASLYDAFPTCSSAADQILVGASYRRANAANGPASALLTVTSPTHLVSAAGDALPFSQISWTVSANSSPAPGIIAAGTFNGGTQTLATVPANTWIENCHRFRYANTLTPAAGTYEGRVTYTLSTP